MNLPSPGINDSKPLWLVHGSLVLIQVLFGLHYFAAKIVRTGGRTILKVTPATWNELQIPKLWELSRAPPRFVWA